MTRYLRSTALAAVALLAAACGGADAPAADESATPAAEAEAPAADMPMEEGLLNPNTASAEQIAAVPGMTAELAAAVVDGRPWTDMLGVDAALAGALDEAAREEVYRHLWLPIDLNAASREEMLLIPGVGDRMAYEFDEYRPYDAMARFRAEIGKYVDEDEVARLEQYVEIR